MGEEIDGAMQQAAQPGRQARGLWVVLVGGLCVGLWGKLSGRLMKAIRLRNGSLDGGGGSRQVASITENGWGRACPLGRTR